MIYKVIITKKALKQLEKIEQSVPKNAEKIIVLINLIKSTDEPYLKWDCKKLKAYTPITYRWRIGEYRIFGIIENKETIKITKIDKRDSKTYSTTT